MRLSLLGGFWANLKKLTFRARFPPLNDQIGKKSTYMGRNGPRAKTKTVLKPVKQWEKLGSMPNLKFKTFLNKNPPTTSTAQKTKKATRYPLVAKWPEFRKMFWFSYFVAKMSTTPKNAQMQEQQKKCNQKPRHPHKKPLAKSWTSSWWYCISHTATIMASTGGCADSAGVTQPMDSRSVWRFVYFRCDVINFSLPEVK